MVLRLTEQLSLSRNIAVIGWEPEALIVSVLLAEAKIPNYLVGPFEQSSGAHSSRHGIEEALWLLAVHQKSGRIKLLPDSQQVPFGEITNAIIASHATNPSDSNRLEMMIRNLAPSLLAGSNLTFTGLCRPNYTSTILRETVEKHSGMRVGTDLGLFYLPLFWAGEPIQAFREKPKIFAAIDDVASAQVQETLLQIFPSMSWTSKIATAEAAGLFTSVYREVVGALELELAKISENQGVDYGEVLGLCKGSGMNLSGLSERVFSRDSIGSAIALGASSGKSTAPLIRAAKRINENYQSQVLQMIKDALGHCGQRLRRSKVAILGLDGLVRNVWSKPEPPQILHALRKRGAYLSLYPGQAESSMITRMVGNGVRVESNLLKAVANANCAVVALHAPLTGELDPKKLAMEMRSPAAVCDLTQVLEASNVERAGLFYTSIGRGTVDT